MRFSNFLVATLVLTPAASLSADVYGLKTHDPTSQPPTHLYVFEEDGSAFTDLGELLVNGASVDADALAIAPTGELYAYQVFGPDSQLLSVDLDTATGTPIGMALFGREIRGAVFDLQARLWVADALSDEVMQIDPATGEIIGTPVALTLDGADFDLSTVCDLAVRSDGRITVCHNNEIYALDPTAGGLSPRGSAPTSYAFAGLTYSAGADCPLHVFFYDVSHSDDVGYLVEFAAYSVNVQYPNVVPQYNAGRGDLAAQPATTGVPCPADLDDDWDTDQADLGVLLAAYGLTAAGDLDGDGDTDQADLGALLADYGCVPCD